MTRLLQTATLLAGCGGMSASESEAHATETVWAEQTDDGNGEKQDFDEDDLNSAYSASSTVIQLSGSTASISAGGATIYGNTVTITRRETYILSGDFNGSVMVDVADALVRLVLENVSVQSPDGPADNGNGTIDYDGAFVITGGMLIGTGSADMTQNVSAGTTQNTVLITLSTPAVSNTVFSVQDAEGNEVATVAPPKQYQIILLSAPGLQSDKSYTVYTGGSSTAPSLDGVYEGACIPVVAALRPLSSVLP